MSFSDLRAEKEQAVKEFARVIRARFLREKWCASGNNCNTNSCAINDCNDSIGSGTECQYDIIASCQCKADTSGGQCDAQSHNDNLCKDVSSALYTPGPSNNTGQLLDMEEPSFRVPKGSVTSKGYNESIVIGSVPLRRDVCSLKQEANTLRDSYIKNNFSAWFYTGTEYGAFMTFPGHAQCRDENAEEDDRFDSCDYNPTERPWYITAATSDRDIVFLYDRNIASSSTLAQSFAKSLGTTDERDAISVRSFEQSPNTEDLLHDKSDNYTLSFATAAQKKEVIKKLPTTGIGKRSNVTAALLDGFRVLRESRATTNCYRFIVLMLGSGDICFNDCSTGQCDCVSKLMRLVDKEQKRFIDGTKATIVAFTQGSGTSTGDVILMSQMERVASSLACSTSGGMWHGVTGDDDENTAMNAFIQVSSLLQFDDREYPNVFGTGVYTDSSGLGLMVTLSAPVYDFQGRRLVSVIGVDILLSEILIRTGLSYDAVRKEIEDYSRESRVCRKDEPPNDCDAQALRFNHRNSNVCPVAKEPQSKGMCFHFNGKFYWRSNYTATFSNANAACEEISPSGSLVVIKDENMGRSLAALVDEDGSWIGLRAVDGKLRWVDNSDADLQGSEFSYNASQYATDQCVAMDRRGVTRNWDLEPCSKERHFICNVDETGCRSKSTDPGATHTSLLSGFEPRRGATV